MSHHATEQGVLFAKLSKKAVVARFDQRRSSSDGGAVLLKACDERLGLSAGLAACLSDGRQRSKVSHTLEGLFRQRMFGIACGYADCNDAARLSDDPVMKLPAGRDPASGASLASQPTLSRFENAPRRGELLRLSEALAESVTARHRRRRRRHARRITIDLDPTVDPTHGGQQGALFSGFHRTWCCLPLTGFPDLRRRAGAVPVLPRPARRPRRRHGRHVRPAASAAAAKAPEKASFSAH